jgi:nucleolar GTP-binding protein
LTIFADDTENYMLDNPDWKYDVLPEIMDGKNVYDLYYTSLHRANGSIDPEIEEKLNALEAEEERLEAGGFYDSDEDIVAPTGPQNPQLRTPF